MDYSFFVMISSLAFVVFSEIRNYYERRNLLDRIMSKDFAEYSDHTRKATIDKEFGRDNDSYEL